MNDVLGAAFPKMITRWTRRTAEAEADA